MILMVCIFPCTPQLCTIVHMQQLRVLYQDDDFIAVEKPAGLQVHPSERRTKWTALGILKKQTGKWIYPVHRLDQATSGVLLFAFSSEMANAFQKKFKDKTIKKTYVTIIRGWLTENPNEKIELKHPLKKENGSIVDSETHFENIFNFEIAEPSSKFKTSRYSIVKVIPKTGRFHQIRRHLKHLSHPIIGDTVYGDGKQNQIWRNRTGDQGLYLKAYSIEFTHPKTGENIYLRSRYNGFWQRGFDLSGVCPIIGFEKAKSHHELEA